MTIIHSKNYSFRKKWELFIQKIIQLEKNYSKKYSFKKFENYSFKKIIHFFEKLIIAQGYIALICSNDFVTRFLCRIGPQFNTSEWKSQILYMRMWDVKRIFENFAGLIPLRPPQN